MKIIRDIAIWIAITVWINFYPDRYRYDTVPKDGMDTGTSIILGIPMPVFCCRCFLLSGLPINIVKKENRLDCIQKVV